MGVEIIIKKMQKVLNVNPDSVLFGDARTQMSRELLKALEVVINRKSDHDRVYWILVHASLDMLSPGGKTIKERIILLDQPPNRLIGTMLFRVDNKNADATLEWCLPHDIPGSRVIAPEAGSRKSVEGAKSVIESAQGLPIYNRG